MDLLFAVVVVAAAAAAAAAGSNGSGIKPSSAVRLFVTLILV